MTDFQKGILLMALLMLGAVFLTDFITRLSFISNDLQTYALVLALLGLAVAFAYLAEKMGLRF